MSTSHLLGDSIPLALLKLFDTLLKRRSKRDSGSFRNKKKTFFAFEQSQADKIENIIRNAYNRTTAILTEHMDKLHAVAKKLYDSEKMTGEEFAAIMSDAAPEAPQESETEE